MELRGKGAFVADRATDWDLWPTCGMRWAALQHSWTWGARVGSLAIDERARSADELVTESFRARARGVAPWWWAWVVPSRVGAFVDALAVDIAVVGEAAPEGIILDLELAEPAGEKGGHRPAWTTGTEDAAAELVRGVRSAWPGEVWVTSHGFRVDHMPWAELRAFDGAMPQAYDADCSTAPGFVGRCVASYASTFPGRIAPVLGANATPPACMRRHAQEAAALSVPAVGWWAWTGLAASAARRAEVAALRG